MISYKFKKSNDATGNHYISSCLGITRRGRSVSRLCYIPNTNLRCLIVIICFAPLWIHSSIMARELPACDGFAFPSAYHGAPPINNDFNFLRPSVNVSGVPAIILSPEDLDALASPLELCLVGKFEDEVPQLDSLRGWLRSQGCSMVTRISRWTNHCAVFFFQSRAEYAMAFTSTFFNLGASIMRLTKWGNNVPAELDSPVAPVWVHFPELPLRFFNKELLFSMGAIFGRPLQLHIDTFNLTRVDSARVLVELDVTAPYPAAILLGSIDDGFKQPVEIPYLPPYCISCCVFGHIQSSCTGPIYSPSAMGESSSVNFNADEAMVYRPESSATRFQKRRRFRARRPP